MLAPVKNHAQVQLVPMTFGEEFFQVALGLLDVPPVAQLPALRQPVNVRVHRESRHAPCLAHHHRGRLVPDPGQGFQLVEGSGHLTRVLFDQQPGKLADRPGLLRRQTDRSDDFLYFLHRYFSNLGGRVAERP